MASKQITNVSVEDMLFEHTMSNIAFGIESYMKHKGIKKKDLADELECSQASLSRIFSGDSNVTMRTIVKILAALDAKMNVAITPSKYISKE